MSDAQQDYADALAAYREALERLQEAKRHIPLSAKDRRKQRRREERAARLAHYIANKEAIDAHNGALLSGITTKALAILHQKVNTQLGAADAPDAKIGTTLRIRLPIDYRINDQPPIGKDDE